MKLYIHSNSHYLREPKSDISELKSWLKSITDKPYRRINKFIYLSLIGAAMCGKKTKVNKDTAVYLATNYGAITSTTDSLVQLHGEKTLPMPLDFINTAANIGGFYIASHFGLVSKNMCISSDVNSFQKALELACTDIIGGEIKSALVGGVDEATCPLDEFCRYTPLENSELLREGSCWLLISCEKDGAIGEIIVDEKMECDFVSYDVGYDGVKSADELEFYKKHGYYGTYPAFVLSYFLENFKGKSMNFISNQSNVSVKAY